MKMRRANGDSNVCGGLPERPECTDARGLGESLSPPRTVEWMQSAYIGRVAARVAHSKGLQAEDVPDLLQELRIALWQAGPEIRVGPAWVFHVAIHKAVDLLRRRVRTRESEQKFASATAQTGHEPELDHLLHARAARLPTRLREFYDLHYGQGLSEREIAARLGVGRASVRWLDQSCRRRVAGGFRLHPQRRKPDLSG